MRGQHIAHMDLNRPVQVSDHMCQGPSHGGSYMAEGTSHIRIELPPHIALGDHLASVSCFLDCLLFACM